MKQFSLHIRLKVLGCMFLFLFISRPGLTADIPVYSGVAITGYTLWSYAPPGWHWLPAPAPEPVARATRLPDDACTLLFTIPEENLPGLIPDKVRFGVSTGFIANGPVTWFSVNQDYAQSGEVSPLSGPVFGQAVMSNARLIRDGGNLRAELTFATIPTLETAWDIMGLIDADGNPDTGYHGAEWLLQNVPLGSTAPPGLKALWFEARPGVLNIGQSTTVTASVSNDTSDAVDEIKVQLTCPQGIQIKQTANPTSFNLKSGENRRLSWTISSNRTGTLPLRLKIQTGDRSIQRIRWITVVDKRDPRREFQTKTGDWVLYPDRPTLQNGNSTRLQRIETKTSAELKHNLFGITTHLPRSVNDEDPFKVSNAIDSDPATCWASRWWRIAVPFEPEQLQVDLGKPVDISQIRFLPAWLNSGVPAGFTIDASLDGHTWKQVFETTQYTLQTQPEDSPLRYNNLCWQCFPYAGTVQFIRFTVTRLNQGATSFFCAPFDPFQFRIAEIVATNSDGALLKPISATATSVHNAWFNTPESTTRTWPLILQSGVKLNRINQWGDRLDWATVEQVKGQYHIPTEVDRAISQSHQAGVEILLTLDYGNNLYQQVKNPPDVGPTWHRGHPFMQCAPTTPEAVEGFANYCAYMAKHFRGQVKYFEVWNEENGWFFDDWATNGNVSHVRAYGRALKAAAQAIKQVNPEAIIVFGGTAGSSLDYPRIALEEGAGPLIDVFAFHPYGHPTPEAAPDNFLTLVGDTMDWRPRPEGITNYEEEIAAFRKLLHKYNPNMQIWANEMNWMAPGEPTMNELGDQSELSQAKYLARFYTMNAWLGCGAVWWSLYNANRVQEWAVVRSEDMAPRAAYFAAQYVSTILDDVRGVHNIRPEIIGDAPADLLVKTFRNGKGEMLIALWRTSPTDDSCQPVPVSLHIPKIKAQSAELFDLVYGSSQLAKVESTNGSLIVHAILIADWPVVLKVK